ncbi:polysaccharide pyruvyl transferase family protein [uncultured Microbacterium sp.]|uniref:polysaccharide pyruvyl transferase family protein n=1 Tax=uncultured Microbacterium sp. TaxID=191216 RepID=UPI0035CA4AF5
MQQPSSSRSPAISGSAKVPTTSPPAEPRNTFTATPSEGAPILSADIEYLDGLRTSVVDALKVAIGTSREVAIVDAPNQRNVGDSLIWAGELAFLARIGLRIRYVADLWSYDPRALRKALPEGGVVLLHGGGNFGDLWIGHQLIREQVIRDLPDYRIVQLPQSIYFKDDARAAAADKVMGAHPDLHILLRDSLSMERAQKQLPSLDVGFCADMALGWDPPQRPFSSANKADVVVIAREDMEASSGLAEIGPLWLDGTPLHVTDWYPRGARAVQWRLARGGSLTCRTYVKIRRRVPALPAGMPDRVGGWALDNVNRVNVAGAVKLYGSARAVVTDRLHAHVLSALLGVPHVALDNSYGKVSGIYRDYTGGFSTAHYARSLAEAQSLARELVARK